MNSVLICNAFQSTLSKLCLLEHNQMLLHGASGAAAMVRGHSRAAAAATVPTAPHASARLRSFRNLTCSLRNTTPRTSSSPFR